MCWYKLFVTWSSLLSCKYYLHRGHDIFFHFSELFTTEFGFFNRNSNAGLFLWLLSHGCFFIYIIALLLFIQFSTTVFITFSFPRQICLSLIFRIQSYAIQYWNCCVIYGPKITQNKIYFRSIIIYGIQ